MFFDQVFITVCGIPVDQLAQESRQEQLHAEHDGQQRKVEKRLIRYGPHRQVMALFIQFGTDHPCRRTAAERNISVPRLPKKYIGERPKRERNETVMRSRYPFTIRSIPNFE